MYYYFYLILMPSIELEGQINYFLKFSFLKCPEDYALALANNLSG